MSLNLVMLHHSSFMFQAPCHALLSIICTKIKRTRIGSCVSLCSLAFQRGMLLQSAAGMTMHACWRQLWDALVWKGQHGHAPSSVVARPQMLADLDVVPTVKALERRCPALFNEPELLRICSLLPSVDYAWFCQVCRLGFLSTAALKPDLLS